MLKRTAIIGEYASEKLFVSGFDIQRNYTKNTQSSKRSKIVGNAKNDAKVTIEGWIRCTDFDELEGEIQSLLEALDHTSILFSIGANPDKFYKVSWDGGSLPRKPNTGGPHAPFTLEFDVLDELAIQGLPVTYGAVLYNGYFFSSLGRLSEDTELGTQRTFFSRGTSLWNKAEGTGVKVSGGTLQLLSHNSLLQSWVIPSKSDYSLGLVLEEDRTLVYVDGRPYVFNRTVEVRSWVFDTGNLSFFGAFAFAASQEYMLLVAQSDSDAIVSVRKINSTTVIDYNGSKNTPVSIIGSLGNTINLNDFGARFSGSGQFMFNSITSEVSASVASEIGSISYSGGITLMPRLNNGLNTVKVANNNDVYVMWRKAVR